MRRVSGLSRPSLVIPAVLSAALVAALLAFGNIANVIALMRGFQHLYLLWVLLLLAAYEVVQYMQWHLLLRALGIVVPGRSQAFAFFVGSATKSLPIGNFFENYLLLRAEGTDFGFTSAATLMSVLLEVVVALAGLLILGLDGWTWLRPLIIIGLAVFLFGALTVHKLYRGGRLPTSVTDRPLARLALHELGQLRAGAAALLHPRAIGQATALGAIYLLLGSSTLYLVLRGLNIGSVSWFQVLAVYFFSLAFGLIFPLPVDIGVTEASGVGAFLAVGLGRSDAVSAMLVMRVLSFGAAVAIALATAAVMPDEVRAVLQARPRPTTGARSLDQLAPPLPPDPILPGDGLRHREPHG